MFHCNNKLSIFMHQVLLVIILLNISEINCDENAKLEIHNTFKPEACPRKAKVTDVITLHYKGQLDNGEVFDSRNDPFSFQLGIGQVIKGWDQGLVGICEGEKRKLVIPPHLAYGDTANEKIPAKSTLTFDVECLKVEDGPNPVNVFKEIDADHDEKLSREEVAQFLKRQLDQAGEQHDEQEQMKMLEEVFTHEDKDSDGFISHEEFSGPKHNHDEL